MKATAASPSNLAFIKYWGVKDKELRIPANGSISMNLSALQTTTTVEFSNDFEKDIVVIDGKVNEKEAGRVSKHLDRIRTMANIGMRAKVVSNNSFPSSTGLSSSASGFAALTVAASKAASLDLNEKQLSILSRLGSGSACRSIPDGFTEWIEGDSNETSYAVSLYAPGYWDIIDIVAVINTGRKDVGTTEGHSLAETSVFFPTRLRHIDEKITLLKKYLQKKNFEAFGELVESEALEMHAVMLTSQPSLIYLRPETITLMRLIQQWRQSGIAVYFSLNTGQDIHILCEQKNQKKVVELLSNVREVKQAIINQAGKGACLIDKHLF